MLESLVKDLEKFLGVSVKLEGKKWHVDLSDRLLVTLEPLNEGVRFSALIAPMPQGNKEDLFIYFMQANYLGQGTGGAAIGLDSNENFLTLSLSIVYDMNYRMFKDKLEEFVNYLSYWREEVERLEQQANK
ncbi:MAG: type III secretion system chaperone [Chlamydiae bacterium]|nr:type III secretion system chaperone [Chlamydiota bacterium]